MSADASVASLLRGHGAIAEGSRVRGLDHGAYYTIARIEAPRLTSDAREGLALLLAEAPKMLEALQLAEAFMSGFEGDESQETLDHDLGRVRGVLRRLGVMK